MFNIKFILYSVVDIGSCLSILLLYDNNKEWVFNNPGYITNICLLMCYCLFIDVVYQNYKAHMNFMHVGFL